MIRAHKIRLKPTGDQITHLHRAFAAARNAWNWGKETLDLEKEISLDLFHNHNISTNEYTHARMLKKSYNKIKPDWVKDKTASATQEAFDDLQRAIKRYFDIQSGKIKLTGEKPKTHKSGWPHWRNKRDHNSFRVTNPYLKNLTFGETTICYNAKIGDIKMCEPLRFDGKIMNATFSYDGEWYWASVQVEIDRPDIPPRVGAVGVDLGLKYLAVTSDGQIIDNPKAYHKSQSRLRRLHRKLDRQKRANNPENYNDNGTIKKGRLTWKHSGQMKRTNQKIKRLHTRIKNIRRNAQHHLTAEMSREYGLIIIEDLNVRGMMKNRRLSKAIADAGFFEIRRQLEYKADYYSGIVGVVGRWFPSSKLCSNCGVKKLDMALSVRNWTCDGCGQQNARDVNAAINLKNEGLRIFVNSDLSPAGSPVTARALTLDNSQVVRETPTT